MIRMEYSVGQAGLIVKDGVIKARDMDEAAEKAAILVENFRGIFPDANILKISVELLQPWER